ncbi:dihydrofolate reductase [Aquimarina agarivorans]|uniref:dihydrofolate reductase n=1 Tax=Aquimarina agarivorans TaxID=980584 RepID=UPI000248ED08|nr:dihydrofolate reductase [Aquimarina agarivorans]
MIILIAAVAENNALGKNNDLLWHLPDDFKRFKKLTSGYPIIMGRKTFESLPGMLSKRKHIIITRQNDYFKEGCFIANTLEQAVDLAAESPKIFIIGGGEIYQQFLEIADSIELTRVHADFEADTYFPVINEQEWELSAKTYHSSDEKHAHAFSFLTYVKRNDFR